MLFERVFQTIRESAESEKSDEFNELLQTYGDLAYRMSLQITRGQETDAQDLVQEAFLRIWRQWDVHRPKVFKGWIYRLMRNLYNDSLRKKYRHPTLSLDAPLDSPKPLADTLGDPVDPIDKKVEHHALHDSVTAALLLLPGEFRLPVILSDMAGLSYDEIAQILTIPVGTVRSRIHRGRVLMRELMADRPSEMNP